MRRARFAVAVAAGAFAVVTATSSGANASSSLATLSGSASAGGVSITGTCLFSPALLHRSVPVLNERFDFLAVAFARSTGAPLGAETMIVCSVRPPSHGCCWSGVLGDVLGPVAVGAGGLQTFFHGRFDYCMELNVWKQRALVDRLICKPGGTI